MRPYQGQIILSAPVKTIPVPPIESSAIKDCWSTENAAWIPPTDTDQIAWSINDQKELIATAKEGHIFTDGKPTHNYGTPQKSGIKCNEQAAKPETTTQNLTGVQPGGLARTGATTVATFAAVAAVMTLLGCCLVYLRRRFR